MAAHYEPRGYIVAQYPRTRLITGRRLPVKRLTEQQSATPAVQSRLSHDQQAVAVSGDHQPLPDIDVVRIADPIGSLQSPQAHAIAQSDV